MKKATWFILVPMWMTGIFANPVVTPIQANTPLKAVIPAKTVEVARTVDTLKTESKDSSKVKRFRISNRPMDKADVKDFLSLFGIPVTTKPESTAINHVWRGKEGISAYYETMTSEMAYTNANVPFLDQKDYLPDSLIKVKSNEILKTRLKTKAESFVFTNYEITMIQRKDAEKKDTVEKPVPAYYFGRYLRKVEERVVLGDAFQIRLGFGAWGNMQSLSYRNPQLTEAGSVTVPTKEFILDSLKKWEKSKTHSRAYTYPFHPDNLKIRSLKPIKVFETYVVSQEKFSDGSQPDGPYLVPSVTVLAQVEVIQSKKRITLPLPEGPMLLHFNFPCRPSSGLCWPDGKEDIQNQEMVTGAAVTPLLPTPEAHLPNPGKPPVAPAK